LVPAVVIRTTVSLPESTTHRLPSGPAAMPRGWIRPKPPNAVPPFGLPGGTFPTAFCPVNQMLPSGPVVMPSGLAVAPGVANSSIVGGSPGVIRPIFPAPRSVNQTLPSGP